MKWIIQLPLSSPVIINDGSLPMLVIASSNDALPIVGNYHCQSRQRGRRSAILHMEYGGTITASLLVTFSNSAVSVNWPFRLWENRLGKNHWTLSFPEERENAGGDDKDVDDLLKGVGCMKFASKDKITADDVVSFLDRQLKLDTAKDGRWLKYLFSMSSTMSISFELDFSYDSLKLNLLRNVSNSRRACVFLNFEETPLVLNLESVSP